MTAVFEGFGGNFASFAYDTSDYEKLAHLEHNVYRFSGATNWQMLRDLTDAVRNTSSEREFIAKAYEIGGEYNKTWRKTERITALHGARSASREVDFAKTPEAILEYRVADLEKSCPVCAPLNGLRMRANDPARAKYPTPAHWRCGCGWFATNETEPTPEHLRPSRDLIDPTFSGLAQEGKVFPEKGNPMFAGVPKEILKQATALIPKRKK